MNTKTSLKMKMILTFIFISTIISAQNDSLSYGEELKENSDYKYRKTYQYLDIKLKSEKRLLKVSPFINFRNKMEEISLEFAFEQKLYKPLSMQVFTKSMFVSGIYNSEFNGNLAVELRYYPGMSRRIAKGISGNNFNGLYFSSGISDLVVYADRKISNYDVLNFINWDPSPYLTVGYQNRLNNWAYLDVFAILGYNKYKFYFSEDDNKFYSTLGFRLGFAWGNK